MGVRKTTFEFDDGSEVVFFSDAVYVRPAGGTEQRIPRTSENTAADRTSHE